MKLIALASLLLLTGCLASASSADQQRFVLVPDPSGISKDIPPGALALDTQTGQLCYTVGGSWTSGLPTIDLCSKLLKNQAKPK